MRTARYNDYGLWFAIKTVIAIILVVGLVIGGCLLLGHFGILSNPVYDLFFPHEHSADADAWITVDPTCEGEGYRYKICSDSKCGEEFGRETIPATGHDIEHVKENEKAHSVTEGGSHELVAICKVCNKEVSRDKVWDGQEHTPEIIVTEENVVNPTCEEDGSKEVVTSCACGEEISRETKVIEATGHTYEWTALYNSDTNTYSLHGVCGIDSNETIVHQYDYNVDFAVEGDETVATCCPTRYIVSCTYNGERVQALFDVDPPRHNHTVQYYDDKDLLYNPQPIELILPDSSYDEKYGEYYNIDEIPGIEPYNVGNSVWDENGFSYGIYKCHTCEEHKCTACGEHGYRFIVRIYSAEYDTRIEDESTKI